MQWYNSTGGHTDSRMCVLQSSVQVVHVYHRYRYVFKLKIKIFYTLVLLYILKHYYTVHVKLYSILINK